MLARIDRMRLSDEDAEQLDADVRVMEHQALETMAEEREKRDQRAARK